MKLSTAIKHMESVLARDKRSGKIAASERSAMSMAVGALRLAFIAANLSKDGECHECKVDGDNPKCNDHQAFDMPSDDAVDVLHSLISAAREVAGER